MTSPTDQPVVRLGMEMLARRDHFSGELARRLIEAGCGPVDVDAAIEALTDRGLLKDVDLATRKIGGWRAAGRSVAECHGRLEALGVPDPVIEAGFEADRAAGDGTPDVDPDLDAATDLLQRWLAGEEARETDPPAARWAARLGRRGFEADTIRAALRHCGLKEDTTFEEHHP